MLLSALTWLRSLSSLLVVLVLLSSFSLPVVERAHTHTNFLARPSPHRQFQQSWHIYVPVLLRAPYWVVSHVDDGQASYAPALAIDTSHHASVSYLDFTEGSALIYASDTGTSWTNTPIDVADPMVFLPPQMHFDALQHPHILYLKNNSLAYASWSGTTWIFQTIPTSSNVIDAGFVLDQQGDAHILYTDGTVLRYAVEHQQQWTVQTMPIAVLPDTPVALALDQHDLPHIALLAQHSGQPTLTYGHTVDTVWQFENISTTHTTADIALALDHADHPHVAFGDTYASGNSYLLRYAQQVESTWAVTEVAVADVLMVRLAFDSSDRAHIFYNDHLPALGHSADTLRYARANGTKWNVVTAADPGFVDGPFSFLIDTDDTVHFSYKPIGREGLRYVHSTQPAPD